MPAGVDTLEEDFSTTDSLLDSVGPDVEGDFGKSDSAAMRWEVEIDKVQEILSTRRSVAPVRNRKPRGKLWLAVAAGVVVCGVGLWRTLVPGKAEDHPVPAPVESVVAVPPAARPVPERVSTATPHSLFRVTAPALQDEPNSTAFLASSEAGKVEGGAEVAVTEVAGPWTNSLGMPFAPVGDVQFSVWETRVRDYEAFVAATGRTRERAHYEESEVHPVTMVSWDDAKAFCNWLTKKELSEGVLQEGQYYRLPTDLEWSMAAGLPGEKGSSPAARDSAIEGQYPWGEAWPPPAGTGNFADGLEGYDDGIVRTAPVGSFSENPFGLHDMAGNIWEWCEDTYSSRNSKRVTRGGSWTSDSSDELASSCRNPVSQKRRGLIYGFRCVLAN